MSASEPLPAELYTRPEAFQRERRGVFESAWLLLARAGALKRPGDYVAQNLGGWPVFAIAEAGGAPKAFRNVCRHQKLPLFDSGAGHCEQIRCRYHGWTYDTNGCFISAPPQVAPGGDLSHDLEPVATERLQGLLFVHLGEGAAALADSLPALASALTEVGLETLGFQTETTTDIDANWKLVIEQAIEARVPDITRTAAWPCLILDRMDGGAVLHQVIARSFHRTCIHHHHYGAPAAGEAVARHADHWKAGALALQSALEADAAAAPPISPELESFRSRIRAAHLGSPL